MKRFNVLQMEREIVDLLECTQFSNIKTWKSRHTMEDAGDTGRILEVIAGENRTKSAGKWSVHQLVYQTMNLCELLYRS